MKATMCDQCGGELSEFSAGYLEVSRAGLDVRRLDEPEGPWHFCGAECELLHAIGRAAADGVTVYVEVRHPDRAPTTAEIRGARLQRVVPVIPSLIHETVHLCPFCDWSLLHTDYDPAGVEAALADHLDEAHDLIHRAHLGA